MREYGAGNEREIMADKFDYKKKWGQNFLSDKNLLRAIVTDSVSQGAGTVLEIGAGMGALTAAIAEKAERVRAYEIDESLKPYHADLPANVEVVYGDFQRANLQTLEKELGEYTVIANLPYYITTPVILRFIEESVNCKGVTVMVQEEVARRLCAKAGTAEYGAVTAAVARKGKAEITRFVPRTLFYPRPNVDSAVVKIDFGAGGFGVKSERAYRDVVRCAFLNRRKTLENNLMNTFRLSREEAKEILSEIGVESGARGETLSPETLGALSDILYERGIAGEKERK